nr:uncharacterized protein LOC109185694 [Ipomoea batatas]
MLEIIREMKNKRVRELKGKMIEEGEIEEIAKDDEEGNGEDAFAENVAEASCGAIEEKSYQEHMERNFPVLNTKVSFAPSPVETKARSYAEAMAGNAGKDPDTLAEGNPNAGIGNAQPSSSHRGAPTVCDNAPVKSGHGGKQLEHENGPPKFAGASKTGFTPAQGGEYSRTGQGRANQMGSGLGNRNLGWGNTHGTQRFGAGQNMATRGMSNSRTRNGNERPKSTSRNNQNKNGNERPRSTSRSNQNRNVQRNPQNVKGVQQQNKGPLQAERGLEANQDTNKELHQREQQDLKEKEKEETAAKKGCLYEDPLDVSDAPVFTANRSPMNLGNIEGDWEVVKGKEKGNMSGVKQGGRENGKKGLGVFEERNRYGVLGERKENLDPGEGLKSGRESEGWCEVKRLGRVVIESDNEDILGQAGGKQGVRVEKCKEGVNCLVESLVRSCKGSSMIYLSVEAIPRAFRRLLDLEGLPHFSLSPECRKERWADGCLVQDMRLNGRERWQEELKEASKTKRKGLGAEWLMIAYEGR